MNHKPEDFSSTQEVERAWLALLSELDNQLPNKSRKRFFGIWFACSFLVLMLLITSYFQLNTEANTTIPTKKSLETPSLHPSQPQKNIPIANNLNDSESTTNDTQNSEILPPFAISSTASQVNPQVAYKLKNTPSQLLTSNKNAVALNNADIHAENNLKTSTDNNLEATSAAVEIDSAYKLNDRLNKELMPSLNLEPQRAPIVFSINELKAQTAQIQPSQYEPQTPINRSTLASKGLNVMIEAGVLLNTLANFGGYVQGQLSKTLSKQLAISTEVRFSAYRFAITTTVDSRILSSSVSTPDFGTVENKTNYNIKTGLSVAYKFKRFAIEMPMGYIFTQNIGGFYTGLGIKYRLNKSLDLSSRYLANAYFSESSNVEHQVNVGLSYRL